MEVNATQPTSKYPGVVTGLSVEGMSRMVEMSGFITAKSKVRNLKDLRQLVAWCDRYRVGNHCEVDYGSGYIYVDIAGNPDVVPASWIECGDHLVDDIHYDILVETHEHPEYKEKKDEQ